MSRHARGRTVGQSLVEFAVILPLFLTLFGAAIDVARVFQAWNVLQSATRDAAEYAATNDTTVGAATTDAATVVCTETKGVPGYISQAGSPGCSSPTVTVSAFSVSTTAPGASTKYPIGSATVTTTLPFRTLFPYPLFTQGGAWTLTSTQSYSIVQGRQ
ncbi:MAG TPA: TadE/TadG family type IV pilus assembly protein [Candidatus Limnocylindrales bacterium]